MLNYLKISLFLSSLLCFDQNIKHSYPKKQLKGLKCLFILFIILPQTFLSRDKSLASLLIVLKNAKNDSIRCEVLAVILKNAPDGEWEIIKQKYIIKEQKVIVEKQKRIVEAKQKEVLDSICYAKRIQQSLLPTKKYINRIISRKA